MPSEKVSQLIEQLSNPNWRTRQTAAEELGSLGDEAKDAIKYLVDRVSNFRALIVPNCETKIEVCISELKAIVSIEKEPANIRELVKQLYQNSNWEVRKQAAESLGEIGKDAKDAIPELEASTFEGEALPVRYSSKIAIARIKEESIPVDEIFLDVFHYIPMNPENTQKILERFEQVIAALNSFAILENLAESALPKIYTLKNLLDAYQDRQSLNQEERKRFDLVKVNTIETISRIEGQMVPVAEITFFLKNSSIEVRKASAISLKRWKSSALEAIEDLRARFSMDASEDVRIEAFEAVIEILKENRKALVQELIKVLEDFKNSDNKICQRAIWELEVLENDARESVLILHEIVQKNNEIGSISIR
ncbi:hypothetical protein TUMEXPCC7403_23015 [Tumidithrix helvetica PCC 7403]|uniref:HEAT repeat domain-containing protein n=1 Tax=Tumidithrix helvetica TaxID=3457545 RepID=UPI003CB85318